MSEKAKLDIIPVNIENELKQSYLDYAMSVIVGRALPDVRDGLKPVHRRILFAMYVLNNYWNKPHKKSARVVGDVIGKYHPHGEAAVYDAIVRLAQPFSMRYTLIDGQGNFGSIDGDAAAALRYTEMRMRKITHEILADLEKETVDFAPNYDGNEMMPVVLPTKVPNLLINGSSGIAVGMATNIPPHNLNEVIGACIHLIDNEDASVADLMEFIKGPDFPTCAKILGNSGIIQAYETGKGRVVTRAKTHFEDLGNNKSSIVVDEIPYQVNKARLVEKIAGLVKAKIVDTISEIRDESDKDGIRVVIELKKHENPEVTLNILFKHTQLQDVFNINMVALDKGQPKTLNLKQVLNAFVQHRKEVVTRRCEYELKKSKERCHILEGLGISLNNIDKVIAIIKSASSPSEAKVKLLSINWDAGFILEFSQLAAFKNQNLSSNEHGLQSDNTYKLSKDQVQAILDLKLHRLTALEKGKIKEEYEQIITKISELIEILGSTAKLFALIKEELHEIKEEFGDARKTEIMEYSGDISLEDLIDPEEVVVTLSHAGYIKYQALDSYVAQKRGGKGKSATKVKDEDFIEKLILANTHDTLLCFSSLGKVYWLKTYDINEASRISKGKPIVNLLPLEKNEKVNAILPIKDLKASQFVFMATQKGNVKKVALEDFSRPRSGGIRALDLVENDRLIGVDITDGEKDIMLFTDQGKVNRFHESEVRVMGRTAKGVRGIKLNNDALVTDLVVVKEEGTILTSTITGYGKRTPIDEFRKTGRGGVGVIAIQLNERNKKALRSNLVKETDEAVMISNQGTMVRIKVKDISVISRNTKGVKLMNIATDERLTDMQITSETHVEELEEISQDAIPHEE